MRIRKRAPAHPGRIIKNHHLKPLSMTITDLANVLGVSRKTLSKIVNERGAITPDMALRLSQADTSPDLWLNLQKNYDLWYASNHLDDWKRVQPIKHLDSLTKKKWGSPIKGQVKRKNTSPLKKPLFFTWRHTAYQHGFV
jgi:addiction module HigA family antidote